MYRLFGIDKTESRFYYKTDMAPSWFFVGNDEILNKNFCFILGSNAEFKRFMEELFQDGPKGKNNNNQYHKL